MNRIWHKRPYKIGDEKKILQLRHSVFGDLDEVRLNISTWYWQFRDNPAGKAMCWVAEDNGVIVGQYTVIPTRFSLKGKETVLAFSCDTMVLPDYRKQGMFLDLANEVYRSLDAEKIRGRTVWGFPNEAALPGFTSRLGWDSLGIIPLVIMPIRPLTMLYRHVFHINRRGLPGAFPKSGCGANSTSLNMQGLMIESIRSFDEEFDALWNRNSSLAPVMQIRDCSYLNWRYFGVPDFCYRPFAIRWKGELAGYMVIRLMNLMGHYFGVLVDLFPFPVIDLKITKSLLRFARTYSKAYGAEFLTCLISWIKPSFFRGMRSMKVPEKINPRSWHLGCRYRSDDKALLKNMDNWYLTYGDTDIV